MGRYIQTSGNHDKAQEIVDLHKAVRVTQNDARLIFDAGHDKAVIVVVDNGFFEAAGYAFDKREFEAFTLPHDHRHKEFLVMDKELAERLAQ